jgi:hypothetical protein
MRAPCHSAVGAISPCGERWGSNYGITLKQGYGRRAPIERITGGSTITCNGLQTGSNIMIFDYTFAADNPPGFCTFTTGGCEQYLITSLISLFASDDFLSSPSSHTTVLTKDWLSPSESGVLYQNTAVQLFGPACTDSQFLVRRNDRYHIDRQFAIR